MTHSRSVSQRCFRQRVETITDPNFIVHNAEPHDCTADSTSLVEVSVNGLLSTGGIEILFWEY
jgi:hypothetical protein